MIQNSLSGFIPSKRPTPRSTSILFSGSQVNGTDIQTGNLKKGHDLIYTVVHLHFLVRIYLCTYSTGNRSSESIENWLFKDI